MYSGVRVKMPVLKKQMFGIGELSSIYLHDSIPDGAADRMACSAPDNPISLEGDLEFNSPIRCFPKTIGALDGVNARFRNRDIRRKP